MASNFLERYSYSTSSIRAIAAELGISDRSLYRHMRRDADCFRRYQQASESHLFVWWDHYDSPDNYIGNMEQVWKDWRIVSALIARAREREKRPVIFHFVRTGNS